MVSLPFQSCDALFLLKITILSLKTTSRYTKNVSCSSNTIWKKWSEHRESLRWNDKQNLQEERDGADSKRGESCLFLRQHCMSSGYPFYYFAACNMCSFLVSYSSNILVSFDLQPHGSTMLYPHVLCLIFSSVGLSFCVCWQEGQWSQSHKPSDFQICVSFLSSGWRSSPAHSLAKGACGLWDSSHSRSSQNQLCQRCGHMKSRLLVIQI